MARKNYSDEFRRQAVDLYESTPGATVRSIAEDLGIQRGTLRHWLEVYGTGKKTAANGTLTSSPLKPTSATSVASPQDVDETPDQHIARLEGRVGRARGRDDQAHHRAGDPSPGGQVFRRGDELVSRLEFVADHQDTFEVKRLCELVQIQRSSYYAWKAGAPVRAARVAADAELVERIRAVHAQDNTVGAPRITAELNDGVSAGERVNHKRVARVMRAAGIVGYRRRRKVATTVPEPADAKVPDLLKRDFTAPAPNRRYVGDITYLPLAGGSNLYLASVIDCYSRRLVGWSMAAHMRTSLVQDALKAAAATRGSLASAVFHSDHGSVYTSKDYARLCADLGVTQSMGAVGTSADNALAESFNATLKREILQDENCWPQEITCRRELFRWLTRYNTRRRHSWCRYQTPVAYETGYAATLPSAA